MLSYTSEQLFVAVICLCPSTFHTRHRLPVFRDSRIAIVYHREWIENGLMPALASHRATLNWICPAPNRQPDWARKNGRICPERSGGIRATAALWGGFNEMVGRRADQPRIENHALTSPALGVDVDGTGVEVDIPAIHSDQRPQPDAGAIADGGTDQHLRDRNARTGEMTFQAGAVRDVLPVPLPVGS